MMIKDVFFVSMEEEGILLIELTRKFDIFYVMETTVCFPSGPS